MYIYTSRVCVCVNLYTYAYIIVHTAVCWLYYIPIVTCCRNIKLVSKKCVHRTLSDLVLKNYRFAYIIIYISIIIVSDSFRTAYIIIIQSWRILFFSYRDPMRTHTHI